MQYVDKISEIVYNYGIMAEFTGKIHVAIHAYTEWGKVMTHVCIRMPKMIVGNQQKKYVAMMAVSFTVILSCSFISGVCPELLVAFSLFV